ncbi:cobaltochelatase subunit CobN [Commensalibacter papalotli (ex Servin-Garciduenas et al. 2014)]|uniref:Cobaltochelatase cobN subunit n=1 Tax=Commensalibacter papalotli (ex Servin-Garciduenas et al. 2014) TaxID=1208583 RepID=W7DYB2_9PROT|nr:cobaltochelatase subunit CobN [Commensalibacter papalotli (ex Servin-Garciduenas et al. 2014)]EUK17639.1 cobaltochelatase cobN subunit [Commensalibacter papalotli (ex Servin-Garciduenas et al. 2014)]
MHLLVREIKTLDEQAPAEDLQHKPADILFLSFSDSDLNIIAQCLEQSEFQTTSIRLVPLQRLRHPMSVDLYIEDTLKKSKFVILRLLGGIEYWRYGTEEVVASCKAHNIPLLVISGEGYDDPKLDELCAVPMELLTQFKAFFYEGGAHNYAHILRLTNHYLTQKSYQANPENLPMVGEHFFPFKHYENQPTIVIFFYRTHLLADNIAPITLLAQRFSDKNINVKAVYLSSLKDPTVSYWVSDFVQKTRPQLILNVTYFSIQQDPECSLFKQINVPVLQMLQPGNSKALWEQSFRGLSQTDLAIQVVLPELDGKILTTAIAFKKEENGRLCYEPYSEGIDLVIDRALGWINLSSKANKDKKIALFLSNYPGVGGQEGHAVGLDSFASLYYILQWLHDEDYTVAQHIPSSDELTAILCKKEAYKILSINEYKILFSELPIGFQQAVLKNWPDVEQDETLQNGFFTLRYLKLDHIVIAIQPERATITDHKTLYHDPDTPPSHGYIATYLWLRKIQEIDAMIHLGTHGTTEWLPGKATALSDECAPAVLLQGLPVIYPFIVNNPGEAACAKRRLGAVTIGHLTPPVNKAILSGSAAELERLIDDYAEADGLDRRRSQLLLGAILDKAESCGLLAETGINRQESGDEIALSHLDAYLCDVKDLQIREGLHIFGMPPVKKQQILDNIQAYAPDKIAELKQKLDQCADKEKYALLNALSGKFIEPGPAGAPTRGRLDVLPTGRNLYSVDPRAIPTQTAYLLAQKAADQLLLRYLQENGDHLRHLVIDLWGSTNLRTGGEDLALAYILMGAKPLWDPTSGRVHAIEITPLPEMDRPRVDVTLRISGFFRDAFEVQINNFDQTIKAIALRDESAEWNPLAGLYQITPPEARQQALTRIYGTAQGNYGTGIEHPLSTGSWQDQKELGELWLKNSAYGYGQNKNGEYDQQGFADRLKTTQAFFHSQDHAEIDLLDSPDYAAHEGGFAAAAKLFDNYPVLYHVDTSKAETPKIRLLVEEVNRITRGRVANPVWINFMMKHSYRGAAEIARSVDALFGFAATLSHRFDQQFNLVFEATLGNDEVKDFLIKANNEAKKAIQNRFKEAQERGLWHPRSNSAAMILNEDEEDE